MTSGLVTLEKVQVLQYGPEGLKERGGFAWAALCPLLAQSRHAQCADECPLLVGKAEVDQPLLYQSGFMSTRPAELQGKRDLVTVPYGAKGADGGSAQRL